MFNVDSELLANIQESTCFGIGYDEKVPECSRCDVKGQCKAKSEGADLPTPKGRVVTKAEEPKKEKTTVNTTIKTDKPTSTKKTTKPNKSKKEKKPLPDNLPDFKKMSMDELQGLADQRNVEVPDYGNPNINRMRLIMKLKDSYRE